MSKFIACKSKAEFNQAAGFDWYKVKKVEGGYIGFSSKSEYDMWLRKK